MTEITQCFWNGLEFVFINEQQQDYCKIKPAATKNTHVFTVDKMHVRGFRDHT